MPMSLPCSPSAASSLRPSPRAKARSRHWPGVRRRGARGSFLPPEESEKARLLSAGTGASSVHVMRRRHRQLLAEVVLIGRVAGRELDRGLDQLLRPRELALLRGEDDAEPVVKRGLLRFVKRLFEERAGLVDVAHLFFLGRE